MLTKKINYINNYNEVGKNFLNNYYTYRNNNINNTYSFFDKDCFITFLGHEFMGFNNYINKLNQLSLTNMKFNINSFYIQPTNTNSLLIIVNGTYLLNNNYINYTESLILKKNLFNKLLIHNSIFVKY